MKKVLKVVGNLVMVVGLLGVGVVGMGGMIATSERPASTVPEVLPPLVKTAAVEKSLVRLTVKTQGTVTPRTEGVLVSEVSGRVVETAPAFATGGFFDKGEVLLRIDPRDFELAVTQAKAQVARAESQLAQVQAEAAVAAEEWKDLGTGKASPLALRKPQLAQAKAARAAARAALEQARLRLDRTVIRAPYDACVRERIADVGQYVAPGAPVARIFAVDCAEVRLPLSDGQLAKLEHPLPRGGTSGKDPRVVLRARVAGCERSWTGRIVRLEGHVDARSRMVYAVARVADPYGGYTGSAKAPLAVGTFVEAEIWGRRVADAAVIPRNAVRVGGRVWVVDEEARLRFRDVEVVEKRGEVVVVTRGLQDGDTVCVSRLETVTEGMKIRTADEETAGATPAKKSEVSK